jgi:hypothetical protein
MTHFHIFDRCAGARDLAGTARVESCWYWALTQPGDVEEHIAWKQAASEPWPAALREAVAACKADRGALVVDHLAILSSDQDVIAWVFSELVGLPVYALAEQADPITPPSRRRCCAWPPTATPING